MKAEQFIKYFDVRFSPKQGVVFDCHKQQRNLSGLEGTGKTFIAFCIIIDACISGDNTSVFFVSPTVRQMKDKQRKLEMIIYNAGKEDIIQRSIGGLIEFINGSKIYFLSGEQKPASAKGFHSIFAKARTHPVIVLLDDATTIPQELAETIMTSLFTAPKEGWKLLLCYNPTDTSHWVYEHHSAGLRKNNNIQTFEFDADDNPLLNKEVLTHLKGISPDYIRRYSGQWDASRFNAFPPDLLNPAIDDTYALNVLQTEKGFSYCLGVDLNDPMAESTGRDRDSAVFLVLGKSVTGDDVSYKLMGYESYQRSTVGEWLDTVRRFQRTYMLEKYAIETPHSASLIEQIYKDPLLTGEVLLCNPHRSNDIFSLKAGYDYLNQCLRNHWLKIPYDAKAILKEMRELKYKITEGREIRYFHKKHHHDDHITALIWALLAMKDISYTGTGLEGIKTSKIKCNRNSVMTEFFPLGNDREFLTIPKERSFF